ncbi:melanocortin receptor 3-like [Actinia tenebrosa]|uniref:Melanocortin receptor 3-like n=1 Tax=Actinia tenebrosa TaxID=6105 RepID=A0A6P8HPU0_ACTTE|nr:melanocortin receptor 3-like [Actinia tenebrosa]
MNGSSTNSVISTPCSYLLPVDEDRQSLQGYFIASIVIMSVITIPTIFLNGLVLVGIWRSPPLHTPSNVLICGLAASDLGAGVSVMPMFIATSVAYSEGILDIWCKVQTLSNLITPFFAGVSFVTITLISVDRMIALKFHLRYASVVTISRCLGSLVCLWIAGLVICSSHLWYVKFLHWATVFIFSLCLGLCTFNNATILLILRYHRVEIKRLQTQIEANQDPKDNLNTRTNIAQRRKSSSNMLWVYGLFIACYAPFLVVRIFKNLTTGHTKATFIAFTFTYFLVFCNSFLNPILYCMKMRPVRRSILALLPDPLRRCLAKHKVEPNNDILKVFGH